MFESNHLMRDLSLRELDCLMKDLSLRESNCFDMAEGYEMMTIEMTV